MRSSWSLGPLFIAVGGIAVSPLGARGPLTPVALAIAALLVAAGVVLLTKRAFALWLAIAAGAVTALTGVVALLGRPAWALPIPAWLSVVLGLYLVIRTVMAQVQANAPKRFVPPLPNEAADSTTPDDASK